MTDEGKSNAEASKVFNPLIEELEKAMEVYTARCQRDAEAPIDENAPIDIQAEKLLMKASLSEILPEDMKQRMRLMAETLLEEAEALESWGGETLSSKNKVLADLLEKAILSKN